MIFRFLRRGELVCDGSGAKASFVLCVIAAAQQRSLLSSLAISSSPPRRRLRLRQARRRLRQDRRRRQARRRFHRLRLARCLRLARRLTSALLAASPPPPRSEHTTTKILLPPVLLQELNTPSALSRAVRSETGTSHPRRLRRLARLAVLLQDLNTARMEGLMSLGTTTAALAPPNVLSTTSTSSTSSFPCRRSNLFWIKGVRTPMNHLTRNLVAASSSSSSPGFAAALQDDGANTLPPLVNCEEDALKIKEWEVGQFQDEIAAAQGIRIRRRPPTGPPQHYVGPFEFRLQNEGNTPRNILEEIVWNKEKEVSQIKERNPLLKLRKDLEKAPPPRDFVKALRNANVRTGLPGLIAEVKKASPSRGVLRENFDPVEIAQAYEKGGAACLSVLTDEKYFQGSFENLVAIRSAGVQCPLLCKEFIVDAWQLYYARTKGADAVLLIAAILPDLDIKYMIKICKMIGLATLVEVHDEREMDRVLAIDGIELIGINNRDLGTFEVDISNTKKLLEGERGQKIRQKDIIVVGESGLFTPADIAYVQEAGVGAVLVGESIVKQQDPAIGITALFGKDIST